MKPLTGEQIRRTWIRFFEGKGHKWMPGVGLIPQGDKSLLWVNAGVTGLKKYFDGSEIPPCRRIVNIQKSIRTNDIENVGYTARHHTFFEMLGNFSIGDYFRPEVIPWAYEILTSKEVGFGLDPEKLYATYNPSDLASRDLWIKAGLAPDHLIPLEGNYWQIGEGPCGPNTEVFYDRGEKWDPKHLGDKLLREDIENDRYIEIWGIVFSQYNAVNGVPREQYKELPSKNIDTGAGLERIACILQGTDTNFETDLFLPIIHEVERISGVKYAEPNLMSFRVIADHIRCLTFALNDGATFSNEGRGYVLRRIIRRAMRYGQKIGIEGAFLHTLVPIVAKKYEDFYPEVSKNVERISKIIKAEEEKFLKTLTSGEAILHKMLQEGKDLSGEDAFRLYDTYGFPIDLTKEIAMENGKKVDLEGFERCMEAQRERARNARGEIESFHKQSKDLLAFKTQSVFDYHHDELKAKVTGLFVDGVAVKAIDERGEVAFDVTPFYAEMGGQTSDTGVIEGPDFLAKVTYVGKAPAGQHLHTIEVEYGSLKIGDEVNLRIDVLHRRMIERNHSATHLMHAALSEVLGEHIAQAGSFVAEDYLRFDFPSMRKLDAGEIAAIEKLVNEKIMEGIEEQTEILPIEEAKKTGAEMEFSEKYGDTVRVVEFGEFSKEFCGGTHVRNTSEIGLFVIVAEEAIAAGVRRIEAKTSFGAYEYLRERTRLLEEGERKLISSDVDFLQRIEGLQNEKESYRKEAIAKGDKLAALAAKSLGDSAESIDGIDCFFLKRPGEEKESLLKLSDSLKSNREDYAIVLLGGSEGKHPCIIALGGKALNKAKAGDLMKTLAKHLLGGGGGRPEMASGQMKTLNGFEEAIGEIRSILKGE